MRKALFLKVVANAEQFFTIWSSKASRKDGWSSGAADGTEESALKKCFIWAERFFFVSDVGWVGWKNESRSQPIEIKFEFDKVREFKAVHIYCNNQFTKDIQVSAADHWRTYSGSE